MTKISYITCDRCQGRLADDEWPLMIQDLNGQIVGHLCLDCGGECLPHSELVKLTLTARDRDRS